MARFTRSHCPCTIKICKHPGTEHDSIGCRHEGCGCIAYKPSLGIDCVVRASFLVDADRVSAIVRIIEKAQLHTIKVRLLEDVNTGRKFYGAGTALKLERTTTVFTGA